MAERRAENAGKQLLEITKQLKAVQHDLANALDREKRLKCAADAWKQEREEWSALRTQSGIPFLPLWRISETQEVIDMGASRIDQHYSYSSN
ncbi:hypothetical protein BDZ89DRAFT_1165553 [Hymenopellis radicata]|nr:hypothetical protein BDZ89DRAFT_1165553 [Hymenopellis radicata]